MKYAIERDEEEIELEFDVECTFKGSPGSGPSWSFPGEPPEAAEYEITNIVNGATGEAIELTSEEADRLYTYVCEEWEEEEPDYD